jgi:hypothetical protein
MLRDIATQRTPPHTATPQPATSPDENHFKKGNVFGGASIVIVPQHRHAFILAINEECSALKLTVNDNMSCEQQR